MALVLVVSLAVGLTVWFAWPGADGGDGLGDRYFPTAGGGGYDAIDYRIDLAYDEPHRTLSGTTRMTAAATTRLGSLHLDLDLGVTEARVNGFKARFVQTGRDVHVISPRALWRGERFTVTLAYAGRPDPTIALGEEREFIIANQPFGASAWYASNDHPSDPATMEVRIRVPADLQALASGTLIDRDIADEAAFDTWHWRSDAPMATYLNFLAVGPFDIEEGVDGRPYLYAVSRQLTDEHQHRVRAELRATPRHIAEVEQIWGPYPFAEMGGIAPAADLPWGALETQPRPVYHPYTLAWDGPTVIVHESAHMWFGNKVTVHRWDDIFLNEAYASYTEWVVEERRPGGESANAAMAAMYARSTAKDWDVPVDDPGPDRLLTNVYTRGPMALHALRNLMGDEQFFALGRDWVANPGSRSLEEWKQRAQQRSPVNLDHYFQVWLAATQKPAPTPENGFG